MKNRIYAVCKVDRKYHIRQDSMGEVPNKYARGTRPHD